MANGAVRAAQYVRMSTEHQRYSIEFQTIANAAFAVEQGYEVVRTYSDAGISGLTFSKRPGLRQLLSDVVSGERDFEVVLVYDVSRWGRFQDPDESAHYEFLCRSAGVRVRYTAEPFDDDGTLSASLVKHLKRAMAAEFSRELSARVSKTQLGLAAQGFWMGGPSPYGFVRHILGPGGELEGSLRRGQRSAIRGNRIILARGPMEEVRVVRRIFRMFAVEGLTARVIARRLNAEGVPGAAGTRWTIAKVRGVLRNEAYLGTNVIGKVRHHLGKREPQPRERWIRAPGAFLPLIGRGLFAAAQRRFRMNKPVVSDAALIEELRDALRRHGRLSQKIINDDPHTHCTAVYQGRFGCLSRVYALVGYEMNAQQRAISVAALRDKPHLRVGRPRKFENEVALARLAELLATAGYLSKDLIDETPGVPHSHALTRRFGGLKGLYDILGYQPSEKQLRGMWTGRVRRTP